MAAALRAMDHDLLLPCRCWFGGGTEIVLNLGEYRVSKDIDFLCADADGYRMLRGLAISDGAARLFGAGVRQARQFRADQYGIRGIVSVAGTALRVEIVREGRIALDGIADPALGVPRLSASDRAAEELLANADRCQDRATCYRDAIDLGMLTWRGGGLPASAFAKARLSYGDDIDRKLAWARERLADPAERRYAAQSLGMAEDILAAAARALPGPPATFCASP